MNGVRSDFPGALPPDEANSDAARRISAALPRWLLLLMAMLAHPAVFAAPPPAGLSAQPLAARSGPRGATMFKLMPPAETGVVTTNRYADPRMWTDHYQELAYGEIGTGVTVGDYDNDGRPDLFVVSKTETSRLFRNLGGWKFEDVTEKAGLLGEAGMLAQGLAWMKGRIGDSGGKEFDPEHWRQGATFADVNNDGWLDLYVCRFAAPNQLYINQGEGTFLEEAAARGLALADASGMAAFCDYDRDGWLDVYIHTSMLDAGSHPAGQPDHLFHNNGNGSFTDVSDRAGIKGEAAGHSATWWDYDEDGWPDLYVANDYAPPDHLYRNRHDGTFTDVIDAVVPHIPYYSMGADIGDVNNDGHIDLFVADMAPTSHEKDQRGMAGSRAQAQAEPASPGTAPQTMFSALYLNTGIGVCQEGARLAGIAATDWTWSPRFEDLDNDGRVDLHVTNGMTREYHNADLLERIMAAESSMESRRMMKAAPPLSEPNLAFRNLGGLEFENVGSVWGLDQRGVSFGSAFGDLDGDGDLDLLFANYLGGVTLLRNDSDAGHRLLVELRGTKSNRFGIGATLRIETDSGAQVRALMLARGVLSGSEPMVHFGLGADRRIHRLRVTWPSGQIQTFEGIDADQRLVITEPPDAGAPAAPATRVAGRFEDVSQSLPFAGDSAESAGADNAPLQPLLAIRPGRRGPALAVVSVGDRGSDSIIIGGMAGRAPRLLRRTDGASSSFEEVALPEAAAAEGPVIAADFDGDGSNDLLIAGAGGAGGSLQLWRGQPHGEFEHVAAGPSVPPGLAPAVLASADFDRDGSLDCFAGGGSRPGEYPLAGPSALLANRRGQFVDVTDTVAAGLREQGIVTSALWSDVNDDGWIDLLTTSEWGSVRYWHNDHGRLFEDQSDRAGFTAGGTGWWSALASADFNGDGRPDFVAGNLGLNTRYRASVEHPVVLYRGDFGGRTALSIEGYDEGGRVYPWLTRIELAAALPAVARRFPRNDAYARATLSDILGADRLAAAHRFTATETRSGVFLSQPNGTYRFQPLPRIAQIAPLTGIVAGDFDGDGWADIYAVQNSFAPVPSVGRFDGGVSQLLQGDGRGGFNPVAPAESNLVVAGEAKAVVVLDLDDDGWPDFVISRRSGPLVAYRNRGLPQHKSARIELHGGPGNPQAIGGRVTVERSDGSTAMSEVAAGCGGWGQSSAALFIAYPASNPPRQIHVRWPDGTTSTHPFNAGSAALTLSHPSL